MADEDEDIIFPRVFDFSVDWYERWNSRSPNSDNIGIENSTAVLTGIIPWGLRRSAVETIFGYVYVSGPSGQSGRMRLYRNAPTRHPKWPWMYATKLLNITGVKPRGTETTDDDNGIPGYSGPLSNLYGEIHRVATYQYAEITVLFEPLPYNVQFKKIGSTTPEVEYNRFCSFEYEPIEEAILGLGGSLLFREGPPGSGNPPQSLPQTIGFIYSKLNIKMTWHHVPESWIFTPEGVPEKLLACIGKVNSDPFLGYSTGTLRCKPPKINRFVAPYSFLDNEPTFWYNIEFNFEHFDPPNGDPLSNKRGHNLFPWRGDNKFYYCTSQAGNLPVFESYDFRLMFSHVSDPLP